MRKSIVIFFIAAFSLLAFDSFSQCAMCQRVAETGHNNDNAAAKGLNKGILYLLSLPYVIGGIGVFAWYRNKKRN